MRCNRRDAKRKGTIRSCEGVEIEGGNNGLIEVSGLDGARIDEPSGVVKLAQKLGVQAYNLLIGRFEEQEKSKI
ncbi:30S ribosomal protein S1 [Sesbania bispinosa]|nr:30S ribosomal protein S1 [Sesbania bispinosa]